MTDAELVERLQARDAEACHEVVARYGDGLYRYLYSMTHDHHLTEDVVGETYLRMLEKIDTYTYYGAPFKAWLYRIAHNLAVNVLKRGQRIVAVDDLERVARPITDPAIRVGNRLDAAEVRDALSLLTEEQRQVILLRFVAGQSPREVAQTLEKSETAVKQLQWRAMRSLERHLSRQD